MPRTITSSDNATAKPRARNTRPNRQQADAATDRQTTSGNGAAAASERPYSPSYDEIAEAAYQRYLRRGGHDGQDFDDWLEAERELRARHA